MNSYSWATSIAALDGRATRESRTIPLLRPSDHSRTERWEGVLKWYGFREGQANRAGFSPSRVCNGASQLIAVLDDEAIPIASFLAAVDRRPFIRCRETRDLLHEATAADIRSVLIIAFPKSLNNRTLLTYANNLAVPWGILTATDLPGLVFATAKLLIAREALPLSYGHLDAIARKSWLWTPVDGVNQQIDLDSSNTWETLNDNQWDTLSIHCHGDGAHANFNSVVLCGVAHQVEQSTSGRHAGGCINHPDVQHCKRIHRSNKRPFRFGDLRTRRLCLFTCNGFSVAGDVYPSQASFILSAAEGFTATVLTTDRRLRFDSWLFPAIHNLLRHKNCMAYLSGILNDVAAFREVACPYLLYGDPAELTGTVEPANLCLDQGNGMSVRVKGLGKLAVCRVLGLRQDLPGRRMERGKTAAVIIDDVPIDEPIEVIDKSSEIEALEIWLQRVALRWRRVRRLEAAISNRQREAQTSDPYFWEMLSELLALSGAIEQSLHQGELLLAEITYRGTWLARVETWRAHLALLINMWDAQFAVMLNERLLEQDLPDTLQAGFYHVKTYEGQFCPRCGCVLRRASARAPLLCGAQHEWVDCPTCGIRESADTGVPHLEADTPIELIPGKEVDVRIRWHKPDAYLLEEDRPALLITHLKDSGRGEVVYRRIDHVVIDQHLITIPVPEDSSLEIHTLRFALIRDLTVSHLRLRVPCVRPIA